jgi:hypothetical protein
LGSKINTKLAWAKEKIAISLANSQAGRRTPSQKVQNELKSAQAVVMSGQTVSREEKVVGFSAVHD